MHFSVFFFFYFRFVLRFWGSFPLFMKVSRVLNSPMRSVAPGEAAALMAQRKMSVIDVRGTDEFRDSRLTGSINIPLVSVQSHPDGIKNIVHDACLFVCRSGVRSKTAAQNFANQFPDVDVYTLEGGLNSAMVHPDMQHMVVTSPAASKVWSMERQVRFTAGLLVALGVSLSFTFSSGFLALPFFVGGGLMFSAATDTCAMARALAFLPWNR